MKNLLPPMLLLVLLAAACGSGATDESADDVLASSSDDGGSSASGSGESGSSGGGEPDKEDAADVVGNPDLDLEELAEVAPDAAEALDGIDDIVSIGDCSSDTVGLRMSYVPDGWQCRVLDQPIGDLDGFTLFKPQNPSGLEITVGSPNPLGKPCEILQMCDAAQPIDLGPNFDMQIIEVGVPIIFGTHNTVDAEAAVVATSPLSDEQLELVTMVLTGVETL